MLKDYLTSKNIDFVEKIVDQDEIVKKEMEMESGGFLGVPFTVITKDDGSKQSVVGFDKGKLDTIFA
jgi:glutaredoxin